MEDQLVFLNIKQGVLGAWKPGTKKLSCPENLV